ncbi:MAG: GldG family protein [Eubacteriales bacterium]|nr:GldG family protein [Eubacteriales bacterium]
MKMPKFGIRKVVDSFKTRSFRVGGYSVVATAIVIAIAVAVNLLANALPASLTQFDTTPGQLFTVSQQTEKLVSGLEEDVTVYWVVRSGYEESYIGTLLDQYEALNSHIKVVKKDPDVNPGFVQQYTDNFTENSLIVEAGGKSRYVDYGDIFVMDYESYYYYGEQNWSFCGESEVTSAIDYVLSEDLPTVYTLTGHGELALPTTFATAVEKENIETAELSLLTEEAIPEDAAALLIYAPQRDISEDEKTKIETYLGNGGKLILITDPPQEGALTNLEAVMAHYGITAQEGIVVEGDRDHYIWGTPYYLLPELNSHTITSPLISSGYYVLLPIAQGLTVSSDLPDTMVVSELLTTSSSAFSKAAGYNLNTYEKEEGDAEGPFALAVLASETLDDGIYGDVVWVSSTSLLDEQTNEMVSGGNQDFFLNILNYLCQSEDSGISIHAKSLSTEYLTMQTSTASMLTVLIIGILPAAYLAAGIYIWFRRKRR